MTTDLLLRTAGLLATRERDGALFLSPPEACALAYMATVEGDTDTPDAIWEVLRSAKDCKDYDELVNDGRRSATLSAALTATLEKLAVIHPLAARAIATKAATPEQLKKWALEL